MQTGGTLLVISDTVQAHGAAHGEHAYGAGDEARASAVVVDAAGGQQRIAGALEIAVEVAVDEDRRALHQGGMLGIAFMEAELPAVEVLGELNAGNAAELQGLGAERSQGARLRGAYGPVDDLRLSGRGEAQQQTEVVEAVLLV